MTNEDEPQAAPTEDGEKELDVTPDSPSSKRKDAPTTMTNSRTKRERKSVERLGDAYVGKKEKELAIGRGLPLGTMENVAANIKGAKMKGTELATAHNLCFGGRGKDRLKKTQLLEFSGYLPVKEGSDAAKQKEIDAKLGEKYEVKANKMTIAGLKQMCDFFDIDRAHKSGKEELVLCLLQFLACPDETLTKTYSKTSKQTTKKKTTKKEEAHEMETIDGISVPTDGVLRTWVRAYLACFNVKKVTTKHAFETCADKFDVTVKDMAATGKKKTLKTILTEEM